MCSSDLVCVCVCVWGLMQTIVQNHIEEHLDEWERGKNYSSPRHYTKTHRLTVICIVTKK